MATTTDSSEALPLLGIGSCLAGNAVRYNGQTKSPNTHVRNLCERFQTRAFCPEMGIGLGVASSYPAAVTVPTEMGIVMSPKMMTTLQLSASFGEMFCPFMMGIAFQFRHYYLFYTFMFAWQTFVLCLLGLPYVLLTRRMKIPMALLRRLPVRERA